MGRGNKKLTHSFFLEESQLTNSLRISAKKMAKRIGEVMSIYYTLHPDEYQRISTKSEQDT